MKTQYEPKLISFGWEHNNTDNSRGDSQLFIALTGSKLFIQNKLKEILKETDNSYGKPSQGIFIHSDGVCDIQTPIWEGVKY